MAGARNTEGADLDTKIDAVVTSWAAYKAVSVAGEDSGAPARYLIKSLFNKLGEDADLENIFRKQIGLKSHGYVPTGSADIVTIDPNSAA